MSYLALLIIVKITVTAFFVALPFLFAASARLEAISGVSVKSPLFFRLYGVAIVALLVGYSFGIPAAESGQFPWGVTCMGIVSNAGGAFLLLRSSGPRSLSFWLAMFFALVAIGLAISMGTPERALEKAW